MNYALQCKELAKMVQEKRIKESIEIISKKIDQATILGIFYIHLNSFHHRDDELEHKRVSDYFIERGFKVRYKASKNMVTDSSGFMTIHWDE